MKRLNTYQIEVLARAVQEEENGVHPHTYPKNETEMLLNEYLRYVYDGVECDIDITVGALLSLYDFWACYFACGADKTFIIKRTLDEMYLRQLQEDIDKWQRSQDKRLEAEVERYGA